jgi:hypothetical protein
MAQGLEIFLQSVASQLRPVSPPAARKLLHGFVETPPDVRKLTASDLERERHILVAEVLAALPGRFVDLDDPVQSPTAELWQFVVQHERPGALRARNLRLPLPDGPEAAVAGGASRIEGGSGGGGGAVAPAVLPMPSRRRVLRTFRRLVARLHRQQRQHRQQQALEVARGSAPAPLLSAPPQLRGISGSRQQQRTAGEVELLWAKLAKLRAELGHLILDREAAALGKHALLRHIAADAADPADAHGTASSAPQLRTGDWGGDTGSPPPLPPIVCAWWRAAIGVTAPHPCMRETTAALLRLEMSRLRVRTQELPRGPMPLQILPPTRSLGHSVTRSLGHSVTLSLSISLSPTSCFGPSTVPSRENTL